MPSLQQKTIEIIEALKRIFWKKLVLRMHKMFQWKWAETVVKRENKQILESILGCFLQHKFAFRHSSKLI